MLTTHLLLVQVSAALICDATAGNGESASDTEVPDEFDDTDYWNAYEWNDYDNDGDGEQSGGPGERTERSPSKPNERMEKSPSRPNERIERSPSKPNERVERSPSKPNERMERSPSKPNERMERSPSKPNE
ncbi:unnamed protein product, partial [Lymnaea stagnalis]